MPSTRKTRIVQDAKRIVVKVGSSLVTNEGRGLDEAAIGQWCRQLAVLRAQGIEVVMVSSGAIAEGMKRLGWSARPKAGPLPQKPPSRGKTASNESRRRAWPC